MQTYNRREVSQLLTRKVREWYNTNQKRLEAAREAREFKKQREALDQQILEMLDNGYAPMPGSEYGIAVLKQSKRVAYEKLYRKLTSTLMRRLPEYKGIIRDVSLKLEEKAKKQELKRVVLCEENNTLYDIIKKLDEPSSQEKKTVKKLELVIFTQDIVDDS
ncbi:MAG TPA: hypothetical protein ENL16_01430 [Candidatus Woesearchaeota archaeon]|nr:hypothetical protein [Candidatus Woesearchaeota archaeon]